MLIETQIPPEPPIVDHGNLTGLGDDDHPQYLNVDGQTAIAELYIGSGYLHLLYNSGSDLHLYSDGDIYLDTTDCVYISGDLDLTGTEITIAYGGLRIRSGVSGYDAEYDNYDNSNHVFQYQGADLFAVKSTGIYIYGGGDSANLKVVSNDFEIWGGMGDIVLYPYDYTIAHYLLAPDGIEFDIYGSENISSSSGDMFYYAYYGHTFYGSNPLQSNCGFASSDGNAGVSETVSYCDGEMYFEDGLLVYHNVY